MSPASPASRATASPWNLLPVGAITPRGWLAAQLAIDLDGFAGHLPELCKEADSDIFVENRIGGGNWRHWWNGETEGKWIDAITRLAHVTGDPATLERVGALLERLIASQDDDGYLGIYDRAWRTSGGECEGDLWTKSLVLLALLAHHEATGDRHILDAVVAAADQMLVMFGADGANPFVGDLERSQIHGHNLLVIEPMLWLHELTGDARYADFSELCYERFNNGSIRWLEFDGWLERISDPAAPMLSHGAHTAAQLRVPLLLFRATGDERYRTAYEVGFEKIQRYVCPSGACKSDECIGEEHAEGFPLPEAGYEYCTITEQLHSLHYAYALTGEARYADRGEWLLFNAAQASRAADGRTIGYICADNQYDATLATGPRWDYSPTHDDAAVCCNPSAARLLAHHVSRMVTRSENGLRVGFYGPVTVGTEVGGVAVDLTIDGDYPFDENITITVTTSAPVAFPLELRIPDWARHGDVACDDMQWETTRPGHVEIDRLWEGTTEVTVSLGAEIEMVRAIDGTCAMRRGPLLFALGIPADSTARRSYPLEGFADIDHVPAPDARWAHAWCLDPADPAAAVVDVRHSEVGTPWLDPPVAITATVLDASPVPDGVSGSPSTTITLVPIGCTTLRRTTFPLVHLPREDMT